MVVYWKQESVGQLCLRIRRTAIMLFSQRTQGTRFPPYTHQNQTAQSFNLAAGALISKTYSCKLGILVKLFNPPENVSELTRLWQADRLPDGRPHVPDNLLERLKAITSEQAWHILDKERYVWQFEGNWFRTHPERILVGRAVTVQMIPYRPDLHGLVQETGEREGRIGGQNSWVIDTLQLNDVMVVDLFGKIRDGTFVGDNLGTSVQTRTHAGA